MPQTRHKGKLSLKGVRVVQERMSPGLLGPVAEQESAMAPRMSLRNWLTNRKETGLGSLGV